MNGTKMRDVKVVHKRVGAKMTEEPSPPGVPFFQSLRKRVTDPGHIASK